MLRFEPSKNLLMATRGVYGLKSRIVREYLNFHRCGDDLSLSLYLNFSRAPYCSEEKAVESECRSLH